MGEHGDMLSKIVDTDTFEAAFETLIEAGGQLIQNLRQTGADALLQGDHNTADWAIQRCKALEGLQKQLKDLQKNAGRILRGRSVPDLASPRGGQVKRKRRAGGLTEKDLETPILVELLDAGGQASTDIMQDRLYRRLRDQLTEEDMAGVPSNPACQHWWNRACWARNTLREEGYIKPDSPRGIWELTTKGREEARRRKDALLREAIRDDS